MGMENTGEAVVVELVKYLRKHMEERLDRQDRAIQEIKDEVREGREEIKESRRELSKLAEESKKTRELIMAGKIGGAFLKWLVTIGVGILALVAATHGGR